MIKKIFGFVCFMCSFNLHAQQYESFTDARDGIIYSTVKLFGQIWMTENLSTDKFQNGDKIRKVSTSKEWVDACFKKEPVWMYSQISNDKELSTGKIYNYYAVIDKRNLSPLNFHIPSSSEFLILSKLSAVELKSQSGWYSNIFTKKVLDNVNKIDRNGFPYVDVDFVERTFKIGGPGSNKSGFNAYPLGQIGVKGNYELSGQEISFWTLTKGEIDNTQLSFRLIWNDNNAQLISSNILNGFYVRCVSGKSLDEIEIEKLQIAKRAKYIKDSIFNQEQVRISELKLIEEKAKKKIRDSVIQTLEVGSLFEEGIVIGFQNDKTQAIIISKDEFSISKRELLDTMAVLKADGIDWHQWQIPTYGNVNFVAKLIKTNKKFKKIFMETKVVSNEPNSDNFYWSNTMLSQLFGFGTFNILNSNDRSLDGVSYKLKGLLRYIKIVDLQ